MVQVSALLLTRAGGSDTCHLISDPKPRSTGSLCISKNPRRMIRSLHKSIHVGCFNSTLCKAQVCWRPIVLTPLTVLTRLQDLILLENTRLACSLRMEVMFAQTSLA